MRSNTGALLVILLCTLAATRALAAASLTPLGDLSGVGGYSRAYGVSADGSVVVGNSWSASIAWFEAFRWTSGDGMVDLGTLSNGGHAFAAYDVSADGSVIVGEFNSGPGIEAFQWTSGGGLVGLGYLGNSSSSPISQATGVSGDGSVVVGRSVSDNANNSWEAFSWTSGGGMVGLGDLPGGAIRSTAQAISADGSVIVGFGTSASGQEASRWTSGGGMVGLGDLTGGAFESTALAASADGSVIVGHGTSASGWEAFRWTSDGGMVGLGILPGAVVSVATGTSADGSVVVGYGALDPYELGYDEVGAFYWTDDGGMQSLWDVLLAHGVDPAADGWNRLSEAQAISADGNTIVGTGYRNDNTEAFVAVLNVVPEPSSLGLLLPLGAAALLRRRRRERSRARWVPAALVTAASLAALTATEAAAIDTEPLNNWQLTADSLPMLLPGTAISNFARLDGAGGDVDFFQTQLTAGEVLLGMVTPLAGLPANFRSPDTMVSVFDDSQARTYNDDDYASELPDFGEGIGSLFRLEAPATADYHIGVSGCCDFAFDGDASGFSHAESGGYTLTVGRVNPAVPGGGFTDTDPDNQTAAGADPIPLVAGTARVAVAELTSGDVDFFRLDLKAGDAVSAMTAPLNDLGASFNSPDTLVGLFDSSGTNLLVSNEDAGGLTSIIVVDENGEVDASPNVASDFPDDQFFFGLSFGSALRALIPADGTYYLAVTGAFDDGFSGAHSETGAYALLVGVAVPEPGSALLAVVAIAACGLRRVVKPNRLRHASHASCKSARNACATSDSNLLVSAM